MNGKSESGSDTLLPFPFSASTSLIDSQKNFTYFINSDPNLTQTQILTPKLNPNPILALTNT